MFDKKCKLSNLIFIIFFIQNQSNNEITKSKDNLTVNPSPLAAIKENINSLPGKFDCLEMV